MSLRPLETPPLKVSRPVAACSRCRNAKIKCDGKLPACTSCEKNGKAAECTSINDEFARGKERSYVSTLETRIDKLQAKIDQAKARKPSVVSIPDDDTEVPSRRPSQPDPDQLNTANHSRFHRRREASAIDDLVSDFGFLSVHATARDFYGFSSAMTYGRLILSACTKEPMPEGTTKALPARYLAQGLMQFYFDNVFILLPLFDESSFYVSLDNMYSKHSYRADHFDHWIVRMVLAIASMSMSEQRGDHHYLEAIGHACAALEHAEDVLHPGEIANVQALVLLTEFAMLDSHHLDSWTLIGAASRAMTDLGLHQDPPKGTVMSKGKLELRRRVYHCVYVLDRITSLVQARSFSFSDLSTGVKNPFRRQSNASPAPSNGSDDTPRPWLQSHDMAFDLVNLRQLQSAWYSDVYQAGYEPWEEPYSYIWNTCDAMRTWFENLSFMPPTMRAYFELDLLYSYIYLLSPSPRVPVVHPYAQKLIFEYSIRYADLMLRLVSESPNAAPVTFYEAIKSYMIGRQLLDVLARSRDMLLDGAMPPLPDVKPTTAPPPVMPVAHLPPGESMQRFNVIRSIQCIKQTSECLSRFGMRWGYMSWSRQYQADAGPLLEELSILLRELGSDGSIGRRQSVWPGSTDEASVAWQTPISDTNSVRGSNLWSGSVGSVPSNNGSISYRSPSNGRDSLQRPPLMQRNSSNFSGGSGSFSNNNSLATPPEFAAGQPDAHPSLHLSGHRNNHSFPQDQFDFAQPQSHHPGPPNFGFDEPNFSFAQHQSMPSTAPTQQFASWGGYSGSGHATLPNTLDEENAAMPPDAESWSYVGK